MSIWHGFDRDVAVQYGLEEAVVIAHLQHWIIKNQAEGHQFREGRTWTYNTVKAYAKIFPYWSEKQVRTIFARLVAKDVLIVGHFPTSWSDRTNWYAFKNERKWLMGSICPNGQMHLPEKANVICPNGQLSNAQTGKCHLPKRANVQVQLNTQLNNQLNTSTEIAATRPSEERSKVKGERDPNVAIFIEEWCEDYRQQFGKPYVVSGAKDGAAIKRLLASTGLGPYELMEVAHRAWACPEEPRRFFWCPKANTIAIFASRWNEITSELDKAGKFAHKGEQQHADLAGVTYGLS